MLRWLLKYEGYPPGVVFALLLHGGLLLFLLGREFQPREIVNLERPVYIAAAISKENPQRVKREEQARRQLEQQRAAERERQRQQEARRAEEERQRQAAAERQRQEQERQRQAEAERQRQAEAEKQRQAEAERQRQAEAERQRQAEAERQRQAEAERQRQAEAERQRQAEAERQRQAEAERQRQAAAAAAAAEAEAASTNLVAQYAALIADLVSQNWIRPPNARNGMVAVVEIRMAPNGEILASNIVQSSGDSNYDRSVDQAVKRLGRVPEMQDLPVAVFERNFRVFTLTFTPEDLLR